MDQFEDWLRTLPPLRLAVATLLALSLACSIAPLGSTPPAAVDTQVAATTGAATAGAPTRAATTAATPAAATSAAAEDGVSLNCDGTYQRVRVETRAEGRMLFIDRRQGGEWRQAWAYNTNDSEGAELGERAGAHRFGGCERLIVVPVDYQGTGGYFQLSVFRWSPDGPEQVFARDGIPGHWMKQEDKLIIQRAVYLYDEPLCCPCNFQVTRYRWDGSDFVEQEEQIEPTYTGTPPPVCSP